MICYRVRYACSIFINKLLYNSGKLLLFLIIKVCQKKICLEKKNIEKKKMRIKDKKLFYLWMFYSSYMLKWVGGQVNTALVWTIIVAISIQVGRPGLKIPSQGFLGIMRFAE